MLSHDLTYKQSRAKLIEILTKLEIKSIDVHMIDYLIMYFPIYLLKQDLGKDSITITFSTEKNNDDEINHLLLSNDFESLPGNGTLNLAVCEPVAFNERGKCEFNDLSNNLLRDGNTTTTISAKNVFKSYNIGYSTKNEDDSIKNEGDSIKNTNEEKIEEIYNLWEGLNYRTYDHQNNKSTKQTHIIHYPFISLPPLYGVACKNNPKINLLKRQYLKDKKYDYWKHFSSNLSLLEKDDFKKLTASLYPKNTTVDWIIRKSDQDKIIFKSNSWVRSINHEFEDIFHEHVDVAFTVQPWVAVEKSSNHQEKPLEIDVVYKSNTNHDYDCTSVMFSTKQAENMIIGDYITKLIINILNYHIRNILKAERNEINDWLDYYCKKVVKDKCDTKCSCRCCKCSEKIGRSGDPNTTNPCTHVNKFALEILADLNIYKVNRHHLTADSLKSNLSDVGVKYFNTVLARHSKMPDKQVQIIADLLNNKSKHKIRRSIGISCYEAIKNSCLSHISLSYIASKYLINDSKAEYKGILGSEGHSPQGPPQTDRIIVMNRNKAIFEFNNYLSLYGFNTIVFPNFNDDPEQFSNFYYKDLMTFDRGILAEYNQSFSVHYPLHGVNYEIAFTRKYGKSNKDDCSPHIYIPHRIVKEFINSRMESFCKHDVSVTKPSKVNFEIYKYALYLENKILIFLILESVDSPSVDAGNLKVIHNNSFDKYIPVFDYLIITKSSESSLLMSLPISVATKQEWEEIGSVTLRGTNVDISKNDVGIDFSTNDQSVCHKSRSNNFHILVFDCAGLL